MTHARLLMVCTCLVHAACSGAPDANRPPSAAAAPASAESTSSVVVGRVPPGALVVLEPATGVMPMPEGGALMDQFAKAFVPEMLFVRVGQEVTFRNSEDQLHNVTVVGSRTGTAVFNISQSPFDSYKHTFDRPGEFAVTCDIHPGMRATIVATTSPHAVYANAGGAFSLPDVAPGSYKLRIAADGNHSERIVEIKGARVDLGASH